MSAQADTLMNALGYHRAATITDSPRWGATIETEGNNLGATTESITILSGEAALSIDMDRGKWLALSTICEHAIRRIDREEGA